MVPRGRVLVPERPVLCVGSRHSQHRLEHVALADREGRYVDKFVPVGFQKGRVAGSLDGEGEEVGYGATVLRHGLLRNDGQSWVVKVVVADHHPVSYRVEKEGMEQAVCGLLTIVLIFRVPSL